MSSQRNLYKTLQVDTAAEPEVIRAAYRRLAHKYHPDSGAAEASEDKMRALNEAYETLSDPLKRQHYDRELADVEAVRRLDEEAEIKRRAAQEGMMELLMRALTQRQPSGGRSIGRARSLAEFNGTAIIKAQDGTYLGLISSDTLEPDSIANSFGSYGSQYSPTSIRNQYGIYGGPYGAQSPYNQYCTTPPMIVKDGRATGYLTVNPYLSPAVSPHDLLAQLGIR